MHSSLRNLVLAGAILSGAAHAQNGEIAVTITNARGVPLEDAVVVAIPTGGNPRVAVKPRDDAIFQVDKEFVPRVTAVLAGTTIGFPNNDSVRHHVYSFSPSKRFELPLYQGVPAKPVVFDKPGVIALGCNIHDWMVAYIYVSESPHFAKTGADGKATISDLPARSYTVRAWHAQLEGEEEQTRKPIEVAKGRRSEITWSLALKPEVLVRRPPASKHSSHY